MTEDMDLNPNPDDVPPVAPCPVCQHEWTDHAPAGCQVEGCTCSLATPEQGAWVLAHPEPLDRAAVIEHARQAEDQT